VARRSRCVKRADRDQHDADVDDQAAAQRVVVVCDSTKFGHRSLALIVPPSAIHTVITDNQVSQEDLEALNNAGVETIIV